MSLEVEKHGARGITSALAPLALALTLPALTNESLTQNSSPPLNGPIPAAVPLPNLQSTNWQKGSSPTPPFTYTQPWTQTNGGPQSVDVPATGSSGEKQKEEAGVLSWLDKTLGSPTSWTANIIQIGGGLLGLATLVLGIRSYRKNPQSIYTESIFIQDDLPSVFLSPGDCKSMGDVFKDILERWVVFSAARKTTEKFPIIFVDPLRYPEIPALFRSDIAATGAQAAVAVLGAKDTRIGKWHLVIVPRKSYLQKAPIIKRDFFTFKNMVEMLDQPLETFKEQVGVNRRHIVHHLEEAAMVAYLHPEVLMRAIREARPELVQQNINTGRETLDQFHGRLHKNSAALLRLILCSTRDSIEMLDSAWRTKSLAPIEAAAPLEAVLKLIEERRAQKSNFERWVEPVIHFLWKDATVSRDWATSRTPPNQLGLYDFFSIAEMPLVKTKADLDMTAPG